MDVLKPFIKNIFCSTIHACFKIASYAISPISVHIKAVVFKLCVTTPPSQNINDRRRRCLAGHLFQNRWKDQGRGFILLPSWPPNCLGQILTVRDFSQHLVLSSKTIRPNIPRGTRCMGHYEMMRSAVCSLAPHSQFVRGARPYLYIDEQKRPTPERSLVLALGMKAWSDDALAEYSMSHFVFVHSAARTSISERLCSNFRAAGTNERLDFKLSLHTSCDS